MNYAAEMRRQDELSERELQLDEGFTMEMARFIVALLDEEVKL